MKKLTKKLSILNAYIDFSISKVSNFRELAKRLAYYLAEINVLHPFREGNGRTSREFIRQLALLNGYRLNLKEVPTKEIMEAMKLSIVYTEKLENILYKSLEKGVDN